MKIKNAIAISIQTSDSIVFILFKSLGSYSVSTLPIRIKILNALTTIPIIVSNMLTSKRWVPFWG